MSKPKSFIAMVTFDGFLDRGLPEEEALELLRKRIHRMIETHPTLSFRIKEVTLAEAPTEVLESEPPDHLSGRFG